jgi:hypothetical protein
MMPYIRDYDLSTRSAAVFRQQIALLQNFAAQASFGLRVHCRGRRLPRPATR